MKNTTDGVKKLNKKNVNNNRFLYMKFSFNSGLERWIEKMYVENIVIGKPIVEPSTIFSFDEDDYWNKVEKEKTYYTDERFLPRILVDIGIYPSVNEIRRNKPELMVELNQLDFLDNLKVSKKRRLWILVGE